MNVMGQAKGIILHLTEATDSNGGPACSVACSFGQLPIGCIPMI